MFTCLCFRLCLWGTFKPNVGQYSGRVCGVDLLEPAGLQDVQVERQGVKNVQDCPPEAHFTFCSVCHTAYPPLYNYTETSCPPVFDNLSVKADHVPQDPLSYKHKPG